MFDIGISKLALIGVVALIVIGPEKLPRVARTVGTLLGKAQRYVNDVKAEVNRSMELDELRKVKSTIEDSAREVEQSVRTHASDFQKEWSSLEQDVQQATASDDFQNPSFDDAPADDGPQDPSRREFVTAVTPVHRHSRKNWRSQRAAMPHWYKARQQVRGRLRSKALRSAAQGESR